MRMLILTLSNLLRTPFLQCHCVAEHNQHNHLLARVAVSCQAAWLSTSPPAGNQNHDGRAQLQKMAPLHRPRSALLLQTTAPSGRMLLLQCATAQGGTVLTMSYMNVM